MRHVTDDPCTRNSTGRGGSPGEGAPSRFLNMNSGTSPFFAQYSWLQMSVPPAACAGAPRPERRLTPTPSPAFLRTVRRGGRHRICCRIRSWHLANDCRYETLSRWPYFGHASNCQNCRSTRPKGAVLLGVGKCALSWRAASIGAKPEE